MKTRRFFNQPGEYQVKLQYRKEGETKDFVGVVRAETKGEYNIKILVEHLVRGTKGRVVVRAVASGGARVELSGMIKISQEAQNTESFLELRALILDEESRASVDPKLEIMANEVKAGHAASVGQMDENQVQYLQSRGITDAQARRLIIEGFLQGE